MTEVISAAPYGHVNDIKGIDLKTGRPIVDHAYDPVLGKDVQDICPSAPGVKDWQPTAWSPKTHLLYIPHQNLCMNWKTAEISFVAGTSYIGATVDMYAGPGGNRGEFEAWDPVQQKQVWAIKENFPVWSGAMVTAGDVAFYGTMDRWFKAVDAKSGKALWQFRTGSGIIGQPVTYMGKDGVQYVAVMSGVGGWPGVTANAEIDPRVRNAALGFAGATQDLPEYTAGGGELYVFALANAQANAGGTQQQGSAAPPPQQQGQASSAPQQQTAAAPASETPPPGYPATTTVNQGQGNAGKK